MPRDYTQERNKAIVRRLNHIADLQDARDDGSLGLEVFKLAQAMILCTLPYSATAETKITRQARLGDGSTLFVTFMAARPGIPMAFGADRKLLTWVFDKAIQSDSPFVRWTSLSDYMRDVGLSVCGKNQRDLRDRFDRVSGLVINVERQSSSSATSFVTMPVIEKANLPAQLHSSPAQIHLAHEPYGFRMNESLWQDIKKHHVAIPRQFWVLTKGSAQMQDLLLWMFYRCYCARSESLIPWATIRLQLSMRDSNQQRLKQLVRRAVLELRVIWPEAVVEVEREGLRVGMATSALLPDDARFGRERTIP